MPFDPVTLYGNHVRLEPLAKNHINGLRNAILDGELWKLFVTLVPNSKHLSTTPLLPTLPVMA
jgi:hypothetical protein